MNQDIVVEVDFDPRPLARKFETICRRTVDRLIDRLKYANSIYRLENVNVGYSDQGISILVVFSHTLVPNRTYGCGFQMELKWLVNTDEDSAMEHVKAQVEILRQQVKGGYLQIVEN